jgi:hypothetical protein
MSDFFDNLSHGHRAPDIVMNFGPLPPTLSHYAADSSINAGSELMSQLRDYSSVAPEWDRIHLIRIIHM